MRVGLEPTTTRLQIDNEYTSGPKGHVIGIRVFVLYHLSYRISSMSGHGDGSGVIS